MRTGERRTQSDRRRAPRGGRRPYDKAGRHPQVLVADGFDVVRRSCAQYLDQLNFDVVQATTHEDMTVLMAMGVPQLILAGLTLRGRAATAPWMDTVSAKGIPMIAIANVDVDVPVIASGRLRRPFTPTQLIAEVRRVLRGSASNDLAAPASPATRIDSQITNSRAQRPAATGRWRPA